MGKQLPASGRFPTNRLAECREIDGGDHEPLLAGKVSIDRFGNLRGRRQVDEPIGLIDRRPLECSRVERHPFIGRKYLVRNSVGH